MFQTAWKFIRFDKAKSIGVTVGIIISTFLIGQQVGIFLFLTGAMKALATNVKADIWVVDNKTRDINQLGKLDLRVLRAVQSMPGVQKAFPLLVCKSESVATLRHTAFAALAKQRRGPG